MLKPNGARFFGKIRIWPKMAKNGQKWPKIGSLSFFSRLLHYFFLIFLHEVRGVQGVKSGRIRFFGKIRIWPKLAKNGSSNQIARFFKVEYLENGLTVFNNFLYDDKI